MPAKRKGKSIGLQTTGTDFEKLLTACFTGYETRGLATIRKVDPPVKVIGYPVKRVIQLENPWLDYAGSWTEIGGRMLILEAKSTIEPRLAIGSGGITPAQMDNLKMWHQAGAVTGIIWHHQGDVRVFPGNTIIQADAMGATSFKARHYRPVQKGEGWIIWDILAALVE